MWTRKPRSAPSNGRAPFTLELREVLRPILPCRIELLDTDESPGAVLPLPVQSHVTQRLSRPRGANGVSLWLGRIMAFARFQKISVSQWTGCALRATWLGCCDSERGSTGRWRDGVAGPQRSR